jgi:hypothetical protein
MENNMKSAVVTGIKREKVKTKIEFPIVIMNY